MSEEIISQSHLPRAEDKAEHDMLSGPVVKTYWRYSLPWALSMVATASATVVDGIFVGRFVGAGPLAAVNLAAPVFTLISGIAYMLVTGGSVRAGKYMGEGNCEGASAMLIKTLAALIAVVSIMSLTVYWNLDVVMKVLGVNDALMPYSRDYLVTLLFFMWAAPLCYALSYFIRVDQRPVLASSGLALTAVINIILDTVLVAWLGMGVRGAALATGIGFLVPCFLFATHFFSAKSSYIWPKVWGGWKEMIHSAWNGASEFVNEISAGIIILLFNRILMDTLGANGVAAFTVVNYTTMMTLILFYGLGDSLAPIISVNRGAGAHDRTRAFLRTALLSVLSLALLIFATFTLFPDKLANLFLPGDAEAFALTVSFMNAWRWAFLFSGLNMVMASFFTGMQWATSSMLVAASRSFVLPVLMLFLLPQFLGEIGIFYATSAAECLTLFLAAFLYMWGKRKN